MALSRNEIARRYREAHPERCREAQRKWRAKDSPDRRKYIEEWRIRHRDRIREYDSIRHKINRELNPEKIRAMVKKWRGENKESTAHYSIKQKYGIGLKEKREMYESQDGKCAICFEPKPPIGSEGLQIDHCHRTGTIRGLLCSKCNRLLSNSRDSVEVLMSAIMYLADLTPNQEVA